MASRRAASGFKRVGKLPTTSITRSRRPRSGSQPAHYDRWQDEVPPMDRKPQKEGTGVLVRKIQCSGLASICESRSVL